MEIPFSRWSDAPIPVILSMVVQNLGRKNRQGFGMSGEQLPPQCNPRSVNPWTVWVAVREILLQLSDKRISRKAYRDGLNGLRQRGADIPEALFAAFPGPDRSELLPFCKVTDDDGGFRNPLAVQERLEAFRKSPAAANSPLRRALLELLSGAVTFKVNASKAGRRPTAILQIDGLPANTTVESVRKLLRSLHPYTNVTLLPTTRRNHTRSALVAALDGRDHQGVHLEARIVRKPKNKKRRPIKAPPPSPTPAAAMRPKGKKTRPPKKASPRSSPPGPAHQGQSTSASAWPCVGAAAPDFAKEATWLTIYIDETWPPPSQGLSATGVIGGIVWIGERPDYQLLPPVKTHSRGNVLLSAVNSLLACPRALPFVMPIRAVSEVAGHKYLDLVRTAVAVLLGWILPQEGPACSVRILCERYPGFDEGTDRTESFRGWLEGLRETQVAPRFARWKVHEVCWTGKETEYVPYGDMVAYLALPLEAARQMAADVRLEQWPGFVHLSRQLWPRLLQLDVAAPAGFAEALLAFVSEQHGTRLCQLVIEHAVRRAQQQPQVAEAVIAALEQAYERKERNLDELYALASPLLEVLPPPAVSAHPRLQLLRMLLELQHANHHGDPHAVQETADLYAAQRASLARDEQELCAFADLNLAVHYNDRFAFPQARALCQRLHAQPVYPFLSPLMRGRIMSSLGQAEAIAGNAHAADARFAEALAAFRESGLPPQTLEPECEQTSIYRAINALDGGLPQARALAEELIGPLPEAAARFSTRHPRGLDYQHHLLLRLLWTLPLEADATIRYLAGQSTWHSDSQHPWELIAMYRGLLLWREAHGAPGNADAFFRGGIDVAIAKQHGAVLRLIAAVIAAVASCCCQSGGFRVEAQSLLQDLPERLPAAADRIDVLRAILDRGPGPDDVDTALRILPFNYR